MPLTCCVLLCRGFSMLGVQPAVTAARAPQRKTLQATAETAQASGPGCVLNLV